MRAEEKYDYNLKLALTRQFYSKLLRLFLTHIPPAKSWHNCKGGSGLRENESPKCIWTFAVDFIQLLHSNRYMFSLLSIFWMAGCFSLPKVNSLLYTFYFSYGSYSPICVMTDFINFTEKVMWKSFVRPGSSYRNSILSSSSVIRENWMRKWHPQISLQNYLKTYHKVLCRPPRFTTSKYRQIFLHIKYRNPCKNFSSETWKHHQCPTTPELHGTRS